MRLRDYAGRADSVLDGGMLSQSPLVDADYPLDPLPESKHTEHEITEALWKVGKYSPADRLNCASCGYNTCRDFASALLDERAAESEVILNSIIESYTVKSELSKRER